MAHKITNSLLISALLGAIAFIVPADHSQAQPATTSGAASLMVLMTRQPDAPLHVTEMFENQDMLAAVTVKNRSPKEIVSYQLGWSSPSRPAPLRLNTSHS